MIVIHSNFLSAIFPRFYCQPDMTSSSVIRQGTLHALFHDGFWKSDHDFLIVIHSNFLSAMHGFALARVWPWFWRLFSEISAVHQFNMGRTVTYPRSYLRIVSWSENGWRHSTRTGLDRRSRISGKAKHCRNALGIARSHGRQPWWRHRARALQTIYLHNYILSE